MTQAMISAPPKRPKRTLTDAQRRLRKADPTMATRMDEFALEMDATLDLLQASLDRDYDLALHADPPPPILDQEEALALELGRFSLAIDPMMEIADGVRKARDEAYMVLGRVEQLIAQRTLDAVQLTPQAALPPPPPPVDDYDDGDPTEDFHVLRADGAGFYRHDFQPLTEGPEAGRRCARCGLAADSQIHHQHDDADDAPTIAYELDGIDGPWARAVTKVGRWWGRVRGWGRRQVHAAATSATLTLRGWA